jgi:hypothetical protein
LARERRRIQNLTRRSYEQQAELDRLRGLQTRSIDDTNRADDADSETVSLSKSELARMIDQRAKELAPTMRDSAAAQERLSTAAKALVKEVGEQQYREMTDDLSMVFPPDRQLAVLRSDAPADMLRYLTDPDNADEAERIARMDDFDSGRALAKIEAKLEARRQAKPQASKAAEPIEAVRGKGGVRTEPTPGRPGYIEWKMGQLRGQ